MAPSRAPAAPPSTPSALSFPAASVEPVAELRPERETLADNQALHGTLYTVSYKRKDARNNPYTEVVNERIHKLLWFLILTKDAVLLSRYRDKQTGHVDKRAGQELAAYKTNVLKLKGHLGNYSTGLPYRELITLVRAEIETRSDAPGLDPAEAELRRTSALFLPTVRSIVRDFSGLRYKSVEGGKSPAILPTSSPRALLALLVQEAQQAKPTADVSEEQAAQARKRLELFLATVKTDPQALTILVELKDQFPDWVWSEIVARTDLRTDSDVADNHALSESQKAAARKKPGSSELIASWEATLKRWETVKSWRQQPSERLRYFVTGLVCNELAQEYQRRLGELKGFPGFIKEQAKYYLTASISGKKGGLARPQKQQDLTPNGSLFVLTWQTEMPGNPPPAGLDYWATDNDAPRDSAALTDGLVKGKYQYSLQNTGGNVLISRTLVGPDRKPVYFKTADTDRKQAISYNEAHEAGELKPDLLDFRQYLTWGHIATIVDTLFLLDRNADYLITIDTNGTGINARVPVANVLNTWNHFVGSFVASAAPPSAAAGTAGQGPPPAPRSVAAALAPAVQPAPTGAASKASARSDATARTTASVVPAPGPTVVSAPASAPLLHPGGPRSQRKSRGHTLAEYVAWVKEVEIAYPGSRNVVQRLRRLYYSDFTGGVGPKFDAVIATEHQSDLPLRSPPISQSTLDGLNETDFIVTPGGDQVDVSHLFAGLDVHLAGVGVQASAASVKYNVDFTGVLTWAGDLASWFVEWQSQLRKKEAATGSLSEPERHSLLLQLANSKVAKDDLLGDLDAQIAAQSYTTTTVIPSYSGKGGVILRSLSESVSSILQSLYGQPAAQASAAATNRFDRFLQSAQPFIPFDLVSQSPLKVKLGAGAKAAIHAATKNTAVLFLERSYARVNPFSSDPASVERYDSVLWQIAYYFEQFLAGGLHAGDAPWPQ